MFHVEHRGPRTLEWHLALVDGHQEAGSCTGTLIGRALRAAARSHAAVAPASPARPAVWCRNCGAPTVPRGTPSGRAALRHLEPSTSAVPNIALSVRTHLGVLTLRPGMFHVEHEAVTARATAHFP